MLQQFSIDTFHLISAYLLLIFGSVGVAKSKAICYVIAGCKIHFVC